MSNNFSAAPIIITSDHAGYELKLWLRDWLQANVKNMSQATTLLGAESLDATDYPDDANQLAVALAQNPAAMGIAICGSGIGISIALNRHNHVRAALCRDVRDAETARQHNNANVLVLAARKTDRATIENIVKMFRDTNFESNAERHQRRVKKLS